MYVDLLATSHTALRADLNLERGKQLTTSFLPNGALSAGVPANALSTFDAVAKLAAATPAIKLPTISVLTGMTNSPSLGFKVPSLNLIAKSGPNPLIATMIKGAIAPISRQLEAQTSMLTTRAMAPALGSLAAALEMQHSSLLKGLFPVTANPAAWILADLDKRIGALAQTVMSPALLGSARAIDVLGISKSTVTGAEFSRTAERTRRAQPLRLVEPLEADSIDTWLALMRADLPSKRAGMRFAIANSPDGLSQAATSAVELVDHLYELVASRTEVVLWASSSPYPMQYVRFSDSGVPIPTWPGRARLVAIRSGFDEVGQELLISLTKSVAQLQNVKHKSHAYTQGVVETLLSNVEDVLAMLVDRH
jgi:hypothetical protein